MPTIEVILEEFDDDRKQLLFLLHEPSIIEHNEKLVAGNALDKQQALNLASILVRRAHQLED